MTLDDYLTRQRSKDPKLTDAAFGEQVGLSQSQISRLRRGEARPSLAAVERIHRATRGKVSARDFMRDGAAA
jgi:transcriptional regulator with XRE-family HTH domain